MKDQRVIYQAGNHNAQTSTYEDSFGVERCAFTRDKDGNAKDYTVPEYLEILNREREAGTPEFACISWEELYPLIDSLRIDRYKVGTMQEVTAERFDEMLCVLPPMQWHRAKTSESFKMSEITAGDITACFVRIGGRFFEGYGRVTTPADRLLDWAAMEYGRLYPEEYSTKYCQTQQA